MTRRQPCTHASRIAIAALVLIPLANAAWGQDPAGLASDPVFQTWKDNTAVQACASCHYEPGNAFASVDKSFSRQTELKFWLAEDKHAIARRRVEPLTKDEVLAEAESLVTKYRDSGINAGIVKGWLGPSNVLSHRMCEKLGYNVKDPNDTQFRDNCLTCHGGYRHDVESDKANFASGQPGISCNYCHQEGTNDRWLDVHGSRREATRKTWRSGTPAQKAKLGMRDLVTTSNQASLCFDCHIGNRKQNRFVTHDMYAAGHPPLPSIELQTFCDQMPQHWRTLSKVHDALPAENKETYFKANFPGVENPGETFWNTRKLLVGVLSARAKTLRLLVDSKEVGDWANYSLYDCAACHHELKTESLRQRRGYPAAPGRPRQPEWVDLQLAHIGAFLVKDEKELMGLEAILEQRIGETPFGDSERVSESAKALLTKIEAAIKTAESTPIDANIARRVLAGLARTPKERLLTYDSARQVVWAMQVIADELTSVDQNWNPTVQELIRNLDEPEVAPGKLGMSTVLPAGRRKFIYPTSLKDDLNRRANFDPEALERRLRQINTDLTADIRQRSQRLVSQPSR